MRPEERQDRRDRRRQDFDNFQDLMAERWFGRQAEADPRHAYFGWAYTFYVLKGGRMGGRDRRQFEVFYGNRPVDQIVESREFPESRMRFVVESGAGLDYRRTLRGNVICFLSPASSEGFSFPENAIILATFDSARSLSSPLVIVSHWRALMSYFECTAIDGAPRWSDKLRVTWLRFSRSLIIDGVSRPPLYQRMLLRIVEWSLTVGLSGAILFGLQWLVGAPPTRGGG